MLYIEEIPRNESSIFYTTDLTLNEIDEIRSWILENCDTSKRHVISESRRGPVKAEGIQINVYYGYNSFKRKPYSVMIDRVKDNYSGYKVFYNEEEALNYYKEAVKLSEEELDRQEKIAMEALNNLSSKGVNLDAWATVSDDTGLDYGLCVRCSINGFYFSRNIRS